MSLNTLVSRVQLNPNCNGRARVQKCPGLSRRSQGSHEKTRFFSIQHFPILSPRLVSSTGLVPCVMLESSPLVCIWSILCPLFVWITVTIIQSSQFKINLSIISPVLTFQELFEEEGVPITAEEVTLDINFKLKQLPWYCGGFTELNYPPIESQAQVNPRCEPRWEFTRGSTSREYANFPRFGNWVKMEKDVICNLMPAFRSFNNFF